jgi:hypothetical protein
MLVLEDVYHILTRFMDSEDRWIYCICTVFGRFQLSYKPRVFAWLVIYQGVLLKARLAKSGLLMTSVLFVNIRRQLSTSFGSVNLLGSVGSFFRMNVLRAASRLHSFTSGLPYLGDCYFQVHSMFAKLWHCLGIFVLFIL